MVVWGKGDNFGSNITIMAKDPAFLFYPGDWLGGTLGMSAQQKGCYIDLLILQFNHGHFTEQRALSVLRECPGEWDEIKHKFIFANGKYYNERLEVEKNKRIAFSESRRSARLKKGSDVVRIYIVRDNVRNLYKIGSSVNPWRRYNELSSQKSPALMYDEKNDRDIKLVWYSDSIERSKEGELHKKFESKRVLGEWFKLSKEDLEWITYTYNGSYVERTLVRTENENENINESRKENINIAFEDFWNLYDKKVGAKDKLEKKWRELTDGERVTAMKHVHEYKLAQPDKKYRKDPATYLNNKSFNDEIIKNGSTKITTAFNSRNGGIQIVLDGLKSGIQDAAAGGTEGIRFEI